MGNFTLGTLVDILVSFMTATVRFLFYNELSLDFVFY